MELENVQLKLTQLEDEKWYFFESGRDFSNEVTGVKLSGNKVFIQYIGGDFEEPFQFWFEYNQDSFNEMWQYEFREDFRLVINKENYSLDEINDISTFPYVMLNDLDYTCKHMGLVEKQAE